MKKILLILVCLCLLASPVFALSAAIQAVVGATSACTTPSGTIVGGDAEGFENGSACYDRYANGTTSPAATGTLSTYDSAAKHGGTYSMSMDMGANVAAYTEWDLGSEDTDCSFRFWFYAPAYTAFKSSRIFATYDLAAWDPATNYPVVSVRYGKDGTGPYFVLSNAAGATSTKIYVTEAAWYKIQVDYNDAGTHELSVWNAAAEEDAESPQTVADSGTHDPRYIYLGQYGTSADYDPPKLYFDDFKFQAAGGDIAD